MLLTPSNRKQRISWKERGCNRRDVLPWTVLLLRSRLQLQIWQAEETQGPSPQQSKGPGSWALSSPEGSCEGLGERLLEPVFLLNSRNYGGSAQAGKKSHGHRD